MEARTDFEALALDAEVLLFCQRADRPGDLTMVLARRHPYETEHAGQRRVGWQSTFIGGQELPRDLKPYAYAVVAPPDPDLLDGGYG